MIGLAVLYWICSHITGLTVGENAFYEELPIDPVTGAMERYGVYLTTEAAPMSRTSGLRQLFSVWVAIGEGATNPTTGVPVAEKYETERLLSQIQNLVVDSLQHYTELCRLEVPAPGGGTLVFTDVRLDPANSKMRGGTLTNGAIVKSITMTCHYNESEATDVS